MNGNCITANIFLINLILKVSITAADGISNFFFFFFFFFFFTKM